MSTKLFVTHPCTVIRRQCQVHQFARSIHLTPVTLVPVVCNMVSKEGALTFWKGSIGACVVYGIANITEIVLSDLFGLPRTVVPNGSTEKYWKHIFLKAATTFAMTPFLISSFIETVRSEAGLGGDDNRVMDVLTKGVDRFRFTLFGARDASRRFSLLHLAIPTVAYRTAHYVIESALHRQFFLMAKRYVNRKPESERSAFHQYVPVIFARLSSSVLTDLILFPIETVLHRMYIQGTRTLIDNLDTGLSAVSITVKYNGFFDCLRSIVEREGFWSLYSGLGALALQYLLHSLLHQLVRACFDRGSEVLRRATANHPALATPPLSSNSSFNGPISSASIVNASGPPLSGPFAQQMSPISARKSVPMVVSPPRDPTQFPTFGESVANFDRGATPPAFAPYQSNGPNVFGSPPIRYRDNVSAPSSSSTTAAPLSLNTDRLGDPFSG